MSPTQVQKACMRKAKREQNMAISYNLPYTMATSSNTATSIMQQNYYASGTTAGYGYSTSYYQPTVQPAQQQYYKQRIAVPPNQPYIDIIHYGDGRVCAVGTCDGVGDTAPQRMPPPREFNKYINASDMLEEFIEYAGGEGVPGGEMMGLPVELFVKWLVIRACEQDQEEHDVVLQLPARARAPKCLGCGKFMVAQPVPLHDDDCASRYFARAA